MTHHYMIRIIFLFANGLIFSVSTSFAQFNYEWTKQYAFGHNQFAGIATDAAGNYYVAGTFYDTLDVDFGPGETKLHPSNSVSVFVAKYNNDGVLVWGKKIGNDNATVTAAQLRVDATGNIYLVGSCDIDATDSLDLDPGFGTHWLHQENSSFRFMWVLKWTTDGSFAWAKTIRSVNATFGYGVIPGAVNVDASGNVFVTGTWDTDLNFEQQPAFALNSPTERLSAFLAKYDQFGNIQMSKAFLEQNIPWLGNPGVMLNRIHLTGSNILLSGTFTGLVDFNPDAAVDTLRAPNPNGIIVKLDNNGQLLQTRHFTSADGYCWINSTAVNASGSIYFTGTFNTGIDFDPGTGSTVLSSDPSDNNIFVGRLSPAGALDWVKSVGGAAYDDASDLALDASGNVWVVGYFADTADFDPGSAEHKIGSRGGDDAYLFALDGLGDFVTAHSWGGSDFDYVSKIVRDIHGNLLMGGVYYSSDAEMDPFARGGVPQGYVYLTKLSPDAVSVKGSDAGASWMVMPNPAAGSFRIAGVEPGSVIRICDLTGSEQLRQIAVSENVFVAAEHLSNGIYFLTVEKAGLVSQRKLVVNR